MKRNKKGFTLIELIAVLVILAIIALIVTPLVMNIVKKAKDSANKRSVDAYGKAVELAIATHLLDYGDYPTSLDNVTVEYTGNEVVCNVKTLNEDGSIYLSECSVKGTEVKDSNAEDGYYHYGKLISNEITYQAYNVGDTVTYNGMNFYVIEDSDSKSDRVTMLKVEPLTVDEVNTYGGVGTENNHVNRYAYTEYKGAARNMNGYGGISYYTSETCGYVNEEWVETNCTNNYNQSDIKYVVDGWVSDKLNDNHLAEDSYGYKVRLMTFEDLTINLGYIRKENSDMMIFDSSLSPVWIYENDGTRLESWYWTMSIYDNSDYEVWGVNTSHSGDVHKRDIGNHNSADGSVRPVVTILKSAI